MKRLDLLLVNAPSRVGVYGTLSSLTAVEPPVWAGLIARYCLNAGHSVEILDAEADELTVDETADRIALENPRLAAFCVYGHQPSASTQCMPGAIATARALRLRDTDVRTLALGTHPSALPRETLADGFDFVAQGEGPTTISLLLHQHSVPKPGGILSIPGLWGYALPPWGVMDNIADLDQLLPNQAWNLFDMEKYRAHNWHLWTANRKQGHDLGGSYDSVIGGYASVQTSLGCPFKCSFCCINAPFTAGGEAPKLRKWSPLNVVDQLQLLVEKYGVNNIKIPDEMFVLDHQHVRGICERIIDRQLGGVLNMWAYARVDTVKNDSLLDLMRRSGFRWLGIGVESASKHVRDGVEKGRFGNEQIIEAVRRVQSHGIHVAANYIFGLPDDTKDSCRATLDLACELNTEMANFYCAMAYPGSPLHKQVAKENPAVLPENNPCGWIGYSQHAVESLPLPTETLTAQEVLDIRDDAWMWYFTRPEYHHMMAKTFGSHVSDEISAMTARGRPRRKHRE